MSATDPRTKLTWFTAFAVAAGLISIMAGAQTPAPYIPGERVTLANFHPPLTPLEEAAQADGATPDKYLIEYKMLPMRDGVRLQTVVVRPKDEEKHPTIVDRTPYQSRGLLSGIGKLAVSRGYAIVIQNERGSEWSEGEFHFLGKTTRDAYDTLSWISAQSWSNGNAGTVGCSSSAENQLKLAAQGHPSLKAAIPMSAGAGVGAIPGVTSMGLFYRGGVPMIGTWSLWYAPFGYKWRPRLPLGHGDEELSKALRNFVISSPSFFNPSYNRGLGESVRLAPSHDILSRLNVPTTDFEILMAGGPTDPDWDKVDFITAKETGATPALNINGWYDVGIYETVKLFEFQQHHPDQYMIVAPSPHCQMMKTDENAKVGDRPVGDSRFPYNELQISWFDRFLQGHESAWKRIPKVQVFLMGANTWLTGDRWPLKNTRKRRLYLVSRGHANSLAGDGVLDFEQPTPQSIVDHFTYDPSNPTPTVGGGMLGAVSSDQRSVEARSDVLVYSTSVLTNGLAAVGDVNAILYISADVLDTDIAVKVVDVYPDGTAYNVQDSILRLRYRDGIAKPHPLIPGEVYRINVGDMVTGNYFAPGHRLRVEIAGANFPNGDRNWNTGGRNDLATAGPIAHVEVYHDSKRVSYLEVTEYTGAIPPHPAFN